MQSYSSESEKECVSEVRVVSKELGKRPDSEDVAHRCRRCKTVDTRRTACLVVFVSGADQSQLFLYYQS
jgi:hypothetical protein